MLFHAAFVRLVVVWSYHQQRIGTHLLVSDAFGYGFFRIVAAAVCDYRHPASAFRHCSPHDRILFLLAESRSLPGGPKHQYRISAFVYMPVYQFPQSAVVYAARFIKRRYESHYRSFYHYVLLVSHLLFPESVSQCAPDLFYFFRRSSVKSWPLRCVTYIQNICLMLFSCNASHSGTSMPAGCFIRFVARVVPAQHTSYIYIMLSVKICAVRETAAIMYLL